MSNNCAAEATIENFQLNRDNYHSLTANRIFMSNSQFRDFDTEHGGCEAMAMAKLAGKYCPDDKKTQLQGRMLHAWSEGTLSQFMTTTPQIYQKNGSLYADYQKIMTMIDILRQDQLAMFVLEGQKEVIFTAEMFGVPWKVMLDVYRPEKRRFAEIKTTRSIRDLTWDDEVREKVSFVEFYKYLRQHAIYAEVERLANGRPEGDWFEGIMVAVSKEDPPDKEVISLSDPGRIEVELAKVAQNMPRILAVKRGYAKPVRCECCAYCRSTKVLDRIINYTELS